MKYIGRTKKTARIVGIICLIAAGLLLIAGAMKSEGDLKTYILCGALILVIGFYKVIPMVTDKGVDTCVSILGIKFHGTWKWKDISFLYLDYVKERPDVLLMATKKKDTRKLILPRNSIQEIVDCAVEKNPKISIETCGENDLHVKGRENWNKDELLKKLQSEGKAPDVKEEEKKPATFHELAVEARKIRDSQKREKQLRKPDPKKLKVKKNSRAFIKTKY